MEAIAGRRIRARVPEFVFLEIGNTLLKYVRADAMSIDEAMEALARIIDAPVERVAAGLLARQALALSVVRGISAYDAAYLALALGTDAILVTADRTLAAHAERSALLPEVRPPG